MCVVVNIVLAWTYLDRGHELTLAGPLIVETLVKHYLNPLKDPKGTSGASADGRRKDLIYDEGELVCTAMDESKY